MIESANRKVSALLTSTGSSSMKDDGSRQSSHGSYMKFTPEQTAQIATYALESGKEPVIVRYSKQCGIVLKESTEDVEDEVHGRIAEEEADEAAANQSAARNPCRCGRCGSFLCSFQPQMSLPSKVPLSVRSLHM